LFYYHWFVKPLVFDVGGLPSDIELEQLLENVEKYKLASHLFWGLWGIISVCFLIYVQELDFSFNRIAYAAYSACHSEILGIVHMHSVYSPLMSSETVFNFTGTCQRN
jgi:hypothetical protein